MQSKKELLPEILDLVGKSPVQIRNSVPLTQLANALHYKEKGFLICCIDVLTSYLEEINSFFNQENNSDIHGLTQIQNNTTSNHNDMASEKFVMKPGMKIYVPELKTHVTPNNITDESALLALSENTKARLNCFSKYPSNLKELLQELKGKSSKGKAGKGGDSGESGKGGEGSEK